MFGQGNGAGGAREVAVSRVGDGREMCWRIFGGLGRYSPMEGHAGTGKEGVGNGTDMSEISRVRFITYLFYLLLGLPVVALIMGACGGGGGEGERKAHP